LKNKIPHAQFSSPKADDEQKTGDIK